jgi:DUF4097 and DUF4098 domain-containing protein YvlB
MMRTVLRSLGIALLFQLSAFAKCPITDGGSLIVRAPIGNLHVDTTGRDAADVTVNSKEIEIKETCTKDRVEITADAPPQIRATVDWTVVVPRTANLDLVTLGGSINMGDSDGAVTLRTTGGTVTVGRIKGKAAIITQGGFIKTGDIGDSAELRVSAAGSLQVGNIAGNAELHTAGGPITAGVISGKVNASAVGGTINIKEATGEVVANADGGDILIGEAARINANTSGGNIRSVRVRGPFKGRTESGNIRLENAAAWVEAYTGQGEIFCRLMPANYADDLHVELQTGIGDITIYVPERMKATFDATVERPTFSQRIYSDFPGSTISGNRIPSFAPVQSHFAANGGGNLVRLHTSLGKIEIRKQ